MFFPLKDVAKMGVLESQELNDTRLPSRFIRAPRETALK
jgi:hypothetical protein